MSLYIEEKKSPGRIGSRLTLDIVCNDFLSSLVVFLVALPLCMGIALACGVSPAQGIVSGIIGGLVIGVLSGSPLQVSGPAAGLIVIVAQVIQTRGLAALGMAVFLAGVIQLVSGTLRLGQWFRAVPVAVVDGMLAGIGLLIFSSQFHVMMDLKAKGSGVKPLLLIPQSIYQTFSGGAGDGHLAALGIAAATLLVLVYWKKVTPKKLSILPAPLAAVLLATALSEALHLPIHRAVLPDHFVSSLHFLSPGDFSHFDWGIVRDAITFALVASAETLICASAVDQLHDGARTRFNQELMAQGIGNVISGIVGGLPITGVIIRSSVNLGAGAKTRISTIFHGIWLFLFALCLPGILRLIPISTLAAVLVVTGCRLMSPARLRELVVKGRGEVLVYAVTFLTIFSTDLLTGVLVGMAVSILRLVVQFTAFSVKVNRGEGSWHVHLEGTATFLGIPKLAAALETIKHGERAVIRFDRLRHIDHACWEIIAQWRRFYEKNNGTIDVNWQELELKRAAF